jgi:hypothetical protein
MSIRDYPGFKWRTIPRSNNDIYDVWEPNFAYDAVISIEGKFITTGNMRSYDTIHEAMDYIRHQAIINFFDED